MKILAIETSCDETAAAVARATANRLIIDSNIVASQIDIHQVFGGVVPEIAAREHVKQILPVINQALLDAGLKPSMANQELDGLAVTVGPGLMTSLLVGVETAKALALAWQLPLIPINHIVGHISANFINHDLNSIKFPLLTLTASGGHTNLLLMRNPVHYQMVGQTLDDAAGEALDKAANLLGLGYPGGPQIMKMAKKFTEQHQPPTIKLPRPMLRRADYNFSFSGLKTALLYMIREDHDWQNHVAEYAYVFEEAVVEVLVRKTIKAASDLKVKTIALAGGVSANEHLRSDLGSAVQQQLPQVDVLLPNMNYTTDNAAMIAAAGLLKARAGLTKGIENIMAQPNYPIK